MSIPTSQTKSSSQNVAMLRRIRQVLSVVLLQAAILFLGSGRLDWTWAWVYLGVYLLILITNGIVLLPHSKEVIAERGRKQEDAKPWDKTIGNLMTVGGFLAWGLAGVDARFGWSTGFTTTGHIVALVVMILGSMFILWAMASNKFFSTHVRIQEERGHSVQTSGPYRYMRHPGYVGMSIYWLTMPLVLGSWWAVLGGASVVIILIVRTALEDRTLQLELPGYADYARQVRYRLLPGIW